MKTQHPLAQLCAAFAVSRSGYHAWRRAEPSARAQVDAVLSTEIEQVHTRHRGRYGARRIQHELRRQGRRHSRKRVRRLMRQQGLSGTQPRRFVPRTTDSAHAHPIAPNRLAQVPAPTGPNQIWVADLTYVPTAEGWLYVAVILDLWSRRVVGWAAGPTLAARLTLAALHRALDQRRPPRGGLVHTDRGVQYASAEHRGLLAAAGLVPSMSRRANPYDNAVMESFFATYKRECVGPAQASGGYATRAEAQADLFAYVETYYNRERLHSALGYQTPVDFENRMN